MAKIVFNKIKFKNFMSVGNAPLEYQLDKHNHTLITATNGGGKSLLLDSICFALFGQPFRKINKPQLINTINGKELVVELEFTVGGIHHKIIRGIKPAIFEIYINGSLLNQDAAVKDYQIILETQILHMNYKAFTQTCIIGAANHTAFMQLPPGHRRELVEELLDIKVFSSMALKLRDRIYFTKQDLVTVTNELNSAKDKLEVKMEYIRRAEEDKNQQISELELKLETYNSTVEILTMWVDENFSTIEELTDKTANLDTLNKRLTEYKIFKTKIERNISEANEKIQYYTDLTDCPSCNQEICEEHKTPLIEKESKNIEQFEEALAKLNIKLEETSSKLEEVKTAQAELNALVHLMNTKRAELKSAESMIKELKTQHSKLANDHVDIQAEKDNIRESAKEVLQISKRKQELIDERNIQDATNLLLKDTGIKTSIIKKYLPLLNSMINKHLNDLDFFVAFEFNEQFEETIKSRHRDAFTFSSFSEGEKLRLNLAILFAWRELARTKNSVNSSILIFDEVLDAALDLDGIHLLTKLIYNITDSNVFLISHKSAWAETFHNNIQLEKVNNFTVMSKS